MDNLLVDLDKVLDDFEAEENSAPGTERKPSGFQEYLEQTNSQTWSDIENMETYKRYENNMYDEGKSRDFSDKELSSVRYDFPYEPEKFDLSEADFAPSTNFGESSYNGSLDSSLNKKTNNEPVVNSSKQMTNYPGIQTHHMNGSIEVDINSSTNGQSQYELLQAAQSKEKNNVLKLQMTQSESVKAPIQADNSPGIEPSKMAFQMNGHSEEAQGLEHSEKPVYHQQLSSIPSLNSINSSPEYDKYPVQCNTPQTPKDPTVNPFEAQLSLSSGGSLSPSLQTSSSQVQPKMDVGTMQDIPKLQNLKEDLKMSCESRDDTEQYWPQGHVTSGANSSRSLPATLHQTVFQNGVNSTGSLPSEIETEAQSAEKDKIANQSVFKEMEIGTEQYGEMIDNYPVDTANGNIYFGHNTKETSADDPESRRLENIVTETNILMSDNNAGQKTYVQNVVGFGNIDEVDDDTDLNAYLGDESEGVSNQETAAQLSKFSSEDQAGYGFAGNQTGHGFSNFSAENQDSLRVCDTEIVNKEDKEQKVRTKLEESDMDTSEVTDDDRTNLSHNTFVEKTDNLNNRDSGFSEAKVDTKEEHVLHQIENSDMEVFKILPTNPNQSNEVTNSNHVITNLASNLSPVANISLDSGVASLNDNLEDPSTHTSELNEGLTDVGARPKDSQNKVNRPNSLMGLSTVDLKSDSPFVMKPLASPSVELRGECSQINKPVNPVIERMVVDSVVSQTEESRQLMENSNSGRDTGYVIESNSDRMEGDESNVVEMRYPDRFQPSEGVVTGRPRSWSPSDSGQAPVQKQKRPTSLNLPPPPTINPASEREMSEEDQTPETDTGVGMETTTVENEDLNVALDHDGVAGAEGGAEAPFIPAEHMDLDPPPPYSSTLGKVAPKWIPDAEAPICMSCESRFTFTKRRHHCRACGKVFCSTCCSMKNRLPYLKNQEARVCVLCHSELAIAERDSGHPPHPNHPSDYCNVAPPTQAASGAMAAAPPSVLVPVLKRDGSNRQSAPKQVMFSDGIRPGGDLTELDGSSEVTRMPPRRSRVQKRVERVAQGQHSPRSRRLRTVAERTTKCLIPEDGLPPLSLPQTEAPGNLLLSNPDPNDFMPNIKDENKAPVIFAINTNLYVSVKIATLDCCVNRTVWCFTTRGMTSVGQEEIVIVLESLPEENTPPKDVFVHLNNVFEDASKGNVITELGHSIFSQSFLGSRDHGGFLYIRASFQCVQKLTLPAPPFLFGILLQKWETPWAKVFPLRLLLRLGAEYRYYPCPLIGIRNRKPVFFEIGHTIMNLLADFRNYQYMLPNIRGVAIHMEDKVTKINFPRNRYEELMKVVNNSNEHVMAIAASFSAEADSHLVCIQNDDGNYQTQAINIQNKPRKVTGASFVVFNGALKTSSGLSAKSSIVEDGLMVQITPDSMLALKQAIRDMHDYPINCGLIGAPKPDETVVVQWVEDDKNINVGVKSPVDGMNMDGIESLRIHHATDYIGEKNIVRWTEIFFIQNEERGSPKWDPVDLSRIGETVATACCMALTQHLEKLKEAQLERIGLRVTLGSDNVGYEAGAKGERLPDVYMNDLDNELIPVIHRATQPDTNIVLELIFEVLE